MVPTPASWEAWFLLLGEHDSCSLLLPTLGNVASTPHFGGFCSLESIFFSISPNVFIDFYIFYNNYSLTLSFSFHQNQKHKSSIFYSLYSFLYKPPFAPFAHLVELRALAFNFLVECLFFSFPSFLVMAPRDNVARKKKKIDKYPASKLVRNLGIS